MSNLRFFPRRSEANADEGIRVFARLAGKREPDGTVWSQIAYEGSWQGHGSGAFELTHAIFEKVVTNFARREDDLPIIHGHPGVGSAEAAYRGVAGWISELRIDKDDKGRVALFARTKWTKRTAQMISEDEIRYCSIVIAFDSVDEVSGEEIGPELLELGVVPAAFLDGMARLAASSAASRAGRANPRALAQKDESKMDLNEILKRAQKLVAFIDAEEQKAAAIEGSPEPDAEAPAEAPAEEELAAGDAPDADEVVEAGDAPEEDVVELEADAPPAEEAVAEEGAGMGEAWLTGLAEELGLDLPALLAQMDESRDAIKAALGAAPEEGTPADDMAAMSRSHTRMLQRLDVSENKVAELGKQIAERDSKLEKLGFEVELSKAIADGAVTDTTAEEIREFAEDSLALARKQLAKRSASPEVPRGRVSASRGPKPSEMSFSQRIDALSDDERVLFDTYKGAGHSAEAALSKVTAKSL